MLFLAVSARIALAAAIGEAYRRISQLSGGIQLCLPDRRLYHESHRHLGRAEE